MLELQSSSRQSSNSDRIATVTQEAPVRSILSHASFELHLRSSHSKSLSFAMPRRHRAQLCSQTACELES